MDVDVVECRSLFTRIRNQIRQGGREGRERVAITQRREAVVEELAFHGAGPDDEDALPEPVIQEELLVDTEIGENRFLPSSFGLEPEWLRKR
jgi:hypothetical protein